MLDACAYFSSRTFKVRSLLLNGVVLWKRRLVSPVSWSDLMLAYGLKVTWVVLCTTGAATSWPILWAVAKATDSWWFPVIYCVAISSMVLVFDIGKSLFAASHIF
jgi:hypothetical protein